MADVPYEQFPTVEPQGAPPNDYQNIQTRPGQFGAQVGEAEQTLGKDVVDTGTFYASVAATHGANEFLNFAQDQLYGNPADPNQPGALNAKGADAMRAVQQATDAINQKRQQLMDSLPPVAQNEFSRATFNSDRTMLTAAATHAREAMNEWAAGTANAQQDIGLRGITQGSIRGDLDQVNASREAIISSEVSKDQAKYGHLSPELMQNAVERGQAIAAIAHVRALATVNPSRASAILDAEAGFLSGTQYDTLKRELKGPLERDQDNAIVRSIIGGGNVPSGSSSGSGSPSGTFAPPPGDVATKISATADHYGVGKNLAMATASIESDFGRDPSTNSSGKTYRGIFQLGPDEHNQMGGGDRDNADVQIDHGVKLLGQRKQELAASLGREPTDAEVYLAHQQGVAGATALINHPDMPAGQAVTQAGGAPRNISANGGDPNAPSRDFVNMWRGKFDRRVQQYGDGSGATTEGGGGGSTQAPATAPIGTAVGDSIAVQQVRHGVGGGEDKSAANSDLGAGLARVGDNPQSVLRRINTADVRNFAGKNVFLSTGASNDPSQVGVVADQVKALQAAGAASVVIPGVGPGVKNADQVNQQHAQTAKDNGAVFFQPNVKWAADGVHPAEVDKVRQQAQAALAQGGPEVATGNTPSGGAGAGQRADQLPDGFPTLADWTNKIPDGLSDESYNRIYAGLAREHGRLVQQTSAERGQVAAAYKGGLAMLSDGRDFSYDPAQIHRLFPSDTADEMISNLEDARAVGQQKVAVATMSPGQIAQQLTANDATLSRSTGVDYARQAKLADSFKTAAQQHFKALQEDPASYVLSTNPDVQRAAQAAEAAAQKPADSVVTSSGQPSPAENYASMMLGEQERLGVPPDQRHVLSKDRAVDLARRITANPEQAPATLQAMGQQWGTAWPGVWHDIATAGKLPAAYQMVGSLENTGDGALLARALHGAGDKDKTEALDASLDKGATGTTRPSQTIRTRIAGDEDIGRYAASMRASGASDQQVGDIVSAIEILAKAKALYANEDPAAAADHAIASAIGKWEFLPNGGARVPRANYDAVAAEAGKTVTGLSLDKLAPPQIYGTPAAPGQATADDWLRVLKASPNWVTAGQAIRLMDNGGRFVRTRDGGFVEVPFNTQPASPAPSPPLPPATVMPPS